MADDDWESREDFEEIIAKVPPRPSDKWAGEDEDQDVKDNWDDEEEDKPAATEGEVAERATQRGKKKKFAKIKEKEDKEEELTAEQLAHLKIKEQKQREEQEILIVKEAFGSSAINDSDPITKDDFDALRKRMISALVPFEKRPPYEDFVEDLIQDLALMLPAKRLKKVKTTVEALYFEKTKAEKVTSKATPGKTPKTKVKLHVEADRTVLKGGLDDDLDDYEDFM